MGHKVHPYGFRLGVTRTWTAKWYQDKEYTTLLKEDITIRALVGKRLANASVSGLEIERSGGSIHLLGDQFGQGAGLAVQQLRSRADVAGVGF